MNEHTIEQQLAWYVNGTLNDEERAEVEAWLDANPQARSQLAEYEFLQETVAEVAADEPQLDPQGFDQLMAQIDELEVVEQHADTAEAPAAQPQRTAAVEPGLMERMQLWLQETFQWQATPAFARVAVVAQFALVAVLGTALLVPEGQDQGYEVLSGEAPATVAVSGVLVDIGLKPDLTVAQLQAFLKTHSATIVDGPNSLGIFRVRLPEGTDPETLRTGDTLVYLQQVKP